MAMTRRQVLAAGVASGLTLQGGARAEEPPQNSIDLVVILKPGESREALLCTRLSRGPGLEIKDQEATKKGGVTATVKHQSLDERPKVFSQKGLWTFLVKLEAAKDAKPGVVDVHLMNTTTRGNCGLLLRALIVAD